MSPAETLSNFDKFPNDAIVSDGIAAALLGVSIWTLRRINPVPPCQISERRRGRRVGDLRAYVRGEVQPPPFSISVNQGRDGKFSNAAA